MRRCLRGRRAGIRHWLHATLWAAACTTGAAHAADRILGPPEVAGIVIDAELAEISGLAASRTHPDVLWAINDSGNPARLFALSTHGRKLAAFDIDGASNVDWEDLAAFSLGDRHYLLIADTGDNGGVRVTLDLLLVEEPRALKSAHVALTRRLTFRWPDGPRDCEAMAVDAERGEILLLSKKRVPAQLFRLPLAALFAPVSNSTAVAEEIAHVRALPQPTAEELATSPRLGRYRAQVSGMALRADGWLAIQTYRDTYLFHRPPAQSWRRVLRGAPQPLRISVMPQPEALAFDPRTGDLFIASERIPSPLLRLRAPPGAPSSPRK
ncbi:MAG: hypothetical protein ABIP49_00795 [Lysobacterales bacterium]